MQDTQSKPRAGTRNVRYQKPLPESFAHYSLYLRHNQQDEANKSKPVPENIGCSIFKEIDDTMKNLIKEKDAGKK